MTGGPFFIFAVLSLTIVLSGCSIAEVRPSQEMAETTASLKAAKEVGADTLAPELYRQAIEAYARAKNEYRFKNFGLAKSFALRAKRFAEEGEYQAILQGGSRSSLLQAEDPQAPPPIPASEDASQSPAGTPAFILEQQKAAAAPATGAAPNAGAAAAAAPPGNPVVPANQASDSGFIPAPAQ